MGNVRRRPQGRLLLAAGAVAFVGGGVLAPAALAPPYGGPPDGPPARVCAPVGAQMTTSKGTYDLLPLSEICYVADPAGGPPARVIPVRPLAMPAPLVLREGETVRFTFRAVPESVVTLTRTNTKGARRGAVYRLSPYTTTWRARPGEGTIVVSTTQWVHTELVGLPVHIETVRYSTLYRTVTRR